MKKIEDRNLIIRIYRTRTLKNYKRRIKIRNRLRGLRRFQQGHPKAEVSLLRQGRNAIRVIVPRAFTLFQETDSCISFINGLEGLLNRRKAVFVDMTAVDQIDYGALSALLAVMFRFKQRRIQFNGNFPNNQNARDIVKQSGFLYRLFDESSDKTIYQINEKHQFVTQGKDGKFDQGLISRRIVPDATKIIWGSPKRCPGIYPIVLELIDNTRAHASKRGKGVERWWLSINHDEVNKKVVFVFLDYGIGIFSSLASKDDNDPRRITFASLQQRLGISSNDKHLEEIVSRGGLSATGLKNRGLGIHGIKLANDRNQISKLFIISNYAFGDVSKSRYVKTSENFNGTLFSWELCYSNEHID